MSGRRRCEQGGGIYGIKGTGVFDAGPLFERNEADEKTQDIQVRFYPMSS